jgi:hypothetical protein
MANGEGIAQQIIERAWVSFKNRVMHPQWPECQTTEMRNAFYAGALSCFVTMRDAAELSDAEAFSLLNGLQREFESFFQCLVSSYAHVQKYDS